MDFEGKAKKFCKNNKNQYTDFRKEKKVLFVIHVPLFVTWNLDSLYCVSVDGDKLRFVIDIFPFVING